MQFTCMQEKQILARAVGKEKKRKKIVVSMHFSEIIK